ncbi:hypothetical protein Tco_1521594, partial [Tanacetum coccineum]
CCKAIKLRLLARYVSQGRRMFPMSSFDVLWLKRSYGEYADGGRLFGSSGLRFLSG